MECVTPHNKNIPQHWTHAKKKKTWGKVSSQSMWNKISLFSFHSSFSINKWCGNYWLIRLSWSWDRSEPDLHCQSHQTRSQGDVLDNRWKSYWWLPHHSSKWWWDPQTNHNYKTEVTIYFLFSKLSQKRKKKFSFVLFLTAVNMFNIFKEKSVACKVCFDCDFPNQLSFQQICDLSDKLMWVWSFTCLWRPDGFKHTICFLELRKRMKASRMNALLFLFMETRSLYPRPSILAVRPFCLSFCQWTVPFFCYKQPEKRLVAVVDRKHSKSG